MKPAKAVLAAMTIAGFVALAGGQGRTPSDIQQRGQAVFKALATMPADAAAVRQALRDVGHVEATYQSEPLKKWVEDARIVGGAIHLTSLVALNRLQRGDAPDDWVEKLTAPLAKGQRLTGLRLAIAPAAEVRGRRDRLVAQADSQVRSGLLELAKKYPQLEKTNWGTLKEALEGASPAGRCVIWAGHYEGGAAGSKTPVEKDDTYNVFVLLRPLEWPVPRGEWAMQAMHSHLALMGQVHVDAGDPNLRADIKKIVDDALAALERLNDEAIGETPATAPATAPASQ